MIRSKTYTAILRDVAMHNRWMAIEWIQKNKGNLTNIERKYMNMDSCTYKDVELLQHLINWKKLLLESETILEQLGELK